MDCQLFVGGGCHFILDEGVAQDTVLPPGADFNDSYLMAYGKLEGMGRKLARLSGMISGTVFLGIVVSCPAHAGFSLNPSLFTNPGALIDPNVVSPIVRSIGFVVDHRAYEGAAPLGTHAGFDISAQATLVKFPNGFRNALEDAGIDNPPIQVLPVPRLNIHKGLGPRVDVGFSWVGYKQFSIIGADFKVVVYHPEEGPTWAIRLNYTSSTLDFKEDVAELKITNRVYKPEILVSRKLDFAEPYLGVGYQYTTGSLYVNIPLPAPYPTISQSVPARGGAEIAFIGLNLRAPNIGISLGLEGEYSTVGAHSLGAKFGFSF